MEDWTKAIPEGRNRWQSKALVWVVGGFVIVGSVPVPFLFFARMESRSAHLAILAGLISLTFGLVVWALRAATPLAAFFGALICFQITVWTGRTTRPLYDSGLTPLMALFVLTYLGGKVGRRTIRTRGTSAATAMGNEEEREAKWGRSASQVLANLGVNGVLISAAMFDLLGVFTPSGGIVNPVDVLLGVSVLGALAEATADTVSSEIGAAFGGRPFLLTSFRQVEAGTDGAVSLLGTLAGCLGAGTVVAVGVWSMGLSGWDGLAALVGGVVGLFFDSLLGATVERRGWLGNDWVNFLSTLVGAVVAWAVARI